MQIDHFFPNEKPCIQFPQEVEWDLPIVIRWHIGNHVSPIHPIISEWIQTNLYKYEVFKY